MIVLIKDRYSMHFLFKTMQQTTLAEPRQFWLFGADMGSIPFRNWNWPSITIPELESIFESQLELELILLELLTWYC